MTRPRLLTTRIIKSIYFDGAHSEKMMRRVARGIIGWEYSASGIHYHILYLDNEKIYTSFMCSFS